MDALLSKLPPPVATAAATASSSVLAARADLRDALIRVNPAAAAVPAVAIDVVVLWALLRLVRLLGDVARALSGRRRPPLATVSRLPLIGGLVDFLGGPRALLGKLHPRYGDVFTVPLAHKRMTFLIGPAASAPFFKASDEDMSQDEVYAFNIPVFGKGVVYDVPLAERREQFRMLGEALKTARLEEYVPKMVAEAEDFFRQGPWGRVTEAAERRRRASGGGGALGTGNKTSDGEVVSLKDELAELIIRTASLTLLGKEVRESMFEEVKDLYNDLDAGMQPISVLLPYLPTRAHAKRDAARIKMKDVFTKVIAARREAQAKGAKPQIDMLQTIMDGSYRDGTKLTEDQITGMLIAGLFAGQHTSSVTSSWLGLFVADDRDRLLPALLEEQKRIIRQHGDNLSLSILSDMPVLHRYMQETLRINPPLVLLMRYARKAFETTTTKGERFTVPKGDIVAVSPTFSGTLDSVWKDPARFDPDRWAPPRLEADVRPYSFLGFGGGRHRCMGENFAFLQVKLIWSLLLRRFNVELVDPFPQPDYEAMVIGPKKCAVRITARVPVLCAATVGK